MVKTALALLFATTIVAAQGAFPKPNGYINDFAGILDANVEQEFDALVHDIERTTTAEISVVTVTSLNGMSVEEYANRLFKQWGIGKKGLNNGILVLIAPNEREMRIEVGYGLEPILTDGLAGEILRTYMLPRFKTGDYPGGVRGGLRRLATVVRTKHVLTNEERNRIEHPPIEQGPLWVLLPFLAMFVAVGGVMIGIGIQTKTILTILIGLFFGGLPYLLGLGVAFWPSIFTLTPVAAFAARIGHRQGRTVKWHNRTGSKGGFKWTFGGKGSDGTSKGFWSSSGGGSSSSSSGGGGSFGGGSSGGGGASGKW